jgi:guanylate kinase
MGAVKQGETALLVVKAEKINGSDQYNSVTIYANPISMEETANKSVKHDQNSGMKTIKRLSLRKAFTEKGDVFVVDAIRIGSTFESVLK